MIAGVNVVTADTSRAAREQFEVVRRVRATALFGQGRTLTDHEADLLVESAAGQHVDQMLTYSAVGTPADVRDYLNQFLQQADADELIVAHQAPTTEGRLRSVTLLAAAMDSVTA